VPLIYIMANTVILDRPSEKTTEMAKHIASSTTDLTPLEQKVLKQIHAETPSEVKKPKHKKPKEPNPLSCKKTKRKSEPEKVKRVEVGEDKVKKRKKRKVKVSSHVKDIVNQKVNILLAT